MLPPPPSSHKKHVVIAPIALALAIFLGDSFWKPFLVAAVIGTGIAHLLAVLWIGKLRAALHELRRGNPLAHFNIANLEGLDSPSVHSRLVFVQSLSGALIGTA